MYIKNLMVHNFKSIETVQIDFNPMTMIIGANAAGKSNIINVLRFIEDIMTDGVENAIALQGGIQYIANANLPRGEAIEIQFAIDLKDKGWIRHLQRQKYALEVEEITCNFAIRPSKRGMGYSIVYDYIKLVYECHSYSSAASKEDRYTPLNIRYSTAFERKKQNATVKIFSNASDIEQATDELKRCLENDNAGRFFSSVVREDKNELMLYRLPLLLPPYFSSGTFIRIFDFDPKELKKPSSMVSTKILDENGANLASVLQTILRKRESSQKLTSLLKEFLPFVDNVSVEHNPDKSVSYKIRECYYNKAFYANFLSDGTVSILALILALYFEDRSSIIILEEPERNIHPKLLANLISSAEDVAKEKQVIITTHNPELLKYTKCDDIRIVTRAECGNSSVTKPTDNLTIKTFLENDLGLEDLFVQGLLG